MKWLSILTVLIVVILISSVVKVTAVSPAKVDEGAECRLAEDRIIVKNPLSNWKFSPYAGSSSCVLEKTDSPPNPLYLSPQIEVVFHTRERIQTSLPIWAGNHMRSIINARDTKMTDVELGGKPAKKITYRKTQANFDKTKSLEVLYQEYLVVEPEYALAVTAYFPEAEAETVVKEVELILGALELK